MMVLGPAQNEFSRGLVLLAVTVLNVVEGLRVGDGEPKDSREMAEYTIAGRPALAGPTLG